MAQPTIHILNKSDYSEHHLVTLPSFSPSPLPPSSLRIQSKIIGLTTNNLTYARMGNLLGWFDIYLPPSDTPAPYNDTSTYGRVAAWGYAEIIDSTVPDIAVGTTVFGFLPIGTLPVDITITPTGFKSQIFVTNPHRQHLWKIYNRLQICPPLDSLIKEKTLDSLGWDALMQALFSTGYNMNSIIFATDPSLRLHPLGHGDWSAEDANLDDSIVIMLNASGKTAMAFAWCLRHDRPKEHQPKTIVGVCSEASKDTVDKSKFYDTSILNTNIDAAKDLIEKAAPRRVVLLDFGARAGARETWDSALQKLSVPYTFISVGGEVRVQSPEETAKRLASFSTVIQVNASELREKGIETGGDAYLDAYYATNDKFKKAGGISGVQLKWENGMEAWEKGWEGFCRDEVSAGLGLVYRI